MSKINTAIGVDYGKKGCDRQTKPLEEAEKIMDKLTGGARNTEE